jgi:hypothetical protein
MDKEFSANINMKKIKWLPVLFIIMLYTFSVGLAFSEENNDIGSANNNIGQFNTVIGTASLIREGESVEIKEGLSFKLYDIAKTEVNSEALITLSNNSLIVLGGPLKSKLESKEYMQAVGEYGETKLSLPYGEARMMTCDDIFNIETPVADINANGTLDFVIWDSTIDGKPATCMAVLKGTVDIKNLDDAIEGFVGVPQLKMSCVVIDGVPAEPYSIPDDLLEELRKKGDRKFTDNACIDECGECEKLNPQGVCIPDNHKLCDDGDECTSNDRCLGGQCRGQRDPSTTNPNCS